MGQVGEESVSSEQGTANDARGGEERAPDRGEERRASPLHLPSSYLLT